MLVRSSKVVAILFALAIASASGPAAANPAQQATGCDDLASPQRNLIQDVSDLDPAGTLGNPELCLFAYPADGVNKAIILSLDDTQQFEAAKSNALSQLPQLGIDPCSIATWEGQGVQPLTLNLDERETLPVECMPRLVAADSEAQKVLPSVQTALTDIISASGNQTGWRHVRPLTVRVYTNIDVAIPEINAYALPILPGETVDTLGQRTRDGQSWYKNYDPVLGSLILLNLTGAGAQTAYGTIKFRTSFTYTAYSDTGLNGNGSVDVWFRQGLDSYQSQRNGGSAPGYLNIAMKGQKNGSEVTSLADLVAIDSWLAHQRAEGSQPVQARAHSAIVFLAESYGIDNLIGLLKQNHDGTLADFEGSLVSLTGQDLATLNATFSTWLSTLASHTGSGGNDFHVDVLASPALNQAEVTVTYDRATACGNARQVMKGATVTFWTQVQQGGALNGTGNLGDATVTVQGNLNGGTPTGTARFLNQTTGCDTGPLHFG